MIKKVKIPPGGIKKRIGFDLDDTLIDHTENRRQIAEKLGLPEDHDDVDEVIYSELSLLAPPMASIHVLEKIRHDFDFFIITRRKRKNFQYATKWVLNRFDMPEKNIFFVERDEDKGPLALSLSLDYFIDNKLSVLNHFPERIKTFLFDKSGKYIKSSQQDITIVHSFEEFLEYLPR